MEKLKNQKDLMLLDCEDLVVVWIAVVVVEGFDVVELFEGGFAVDEGIVEVDVEGGSAVVSLVEGIVALA